MKSLKELLELVSKAICENNFIDGYNHWFIDFHGHVNQISMKHFDAGWSVKNNKQAIHDSCSVYLTPDGIQEAYWFIKNRLKIK
jgi:predicted HicB family RNase H-like nuclease